MEEMDFYQPEFKRHCKESNNDPYNLNYQTFGVSDMGSTRLNGVENSDFAFDETKVPTFYNSLLYGCDDSY